MALKDLPAWAKDDLVVLGRRIQDYRRAADLSQDELADRIGLNRRHVQRLENGRADPRASWLMRIAREVQVPVAELMDITSDAPQPPPAAKPRRWRKRPQVG